MTGAVLAQAVVTIAVLPAAGRSAAGAAVSGADGQRAARQELSRPEYHRDDPSLLNRAVTWLFHQLDRLGGASFGQSALAVVAVILVGGVVLMVIRAGRPTTSARAATTGVDPLRAAAARDHARAAQELTEAGRYTEALREWLRATVRTLEDRGVLDPRPGRTADDIARIAGAALPDAAAALRAATAAFDAVWFGGRAATAADAAAGRVAAEAVRQAGAGSGPAAAAQYAVPR